MINRSLLAILFAILPLLSNFVAFQPAQSSITEKVILTDSVPNVAAGQASTAMTDTVSGDLIAMMNHMNQMMVVMQRMMGDTNQMSEKMQDSAMDSGAMRSNAMQGISNMTMTDSEMTDSTMNGMSSNMSVDAMSADSMSANMMMTMSNMNEMMMMCMADMMNSNKKWYWIGGITLALLLLGLLGWWLWRNRARFSPSDSPLLILQRRLAQGAITLEQYEAIRLHLSAGQVAVGDKEL